jgi:hypothetical protein
MIRTALIAVMGLAIAGAALAAPVPSDKINGFKKGVTTHAEVAAALGAPVKAERTPDGGSTARYDYTVPPSDKNPTGQIIILCIYDAKDVFQGIQVFAPNPPGAAKTPPGAPPPGPMAAEPLRDENLLTPLEDGFKVASQGRNGQIGGSEMVPQDETVQVWTRMVTSQTFFGRSHADPDGIPGGMAKSWPQACPGGSGQRIEKGTENGYATSLWAFRCPLNPQTGKPENMWMKVISGADALYDVQYAYRRAYADDMAAQATAFLKRVKVCDTRDPANHPCPDLKPGAR